MRVGRGAILTVVRHYSPLAHTGVIPAVETPELIPDFRAVFGIDRRRTRTELVPVRAAIRIGNVDHVLVVLDRVSMLRCDVVLVPRTRTVDRRAVLD